MLDYPALPFHNKPENFPLCVLQGAWWWWLLCRAYWIFQEFWIFGLMPQGAFPSLLLLFAPAVVLLNPFPVQVPVSLGNKLQVLLASSWVSLCELWILWETWAAAIKSPSPLSLNSIMHAANCTSQVLDLWCCEMICASSSQTSRSASPSLGGLKSWGCQALWRMAQVWKGLFSSSTEPQARLCLGGLIPFPTGPSDYK